MTPSAIRMIIDLEEIFLEIWRHFLFNPDHEEKSTNSCAYLVFVPAWKVGLFTIPVTYHLRTFTSRYFTKQYCLQMCSSARWMQRIWAKRVVSIDWKLNGILLEILQRTILAGFLPCASYPGHLCSLLMFWHFTSMPLRIPLCTF